MIAVPLAQLAKHRATKWFWSVYPLMVTFVIIATANHFVLDAVLGALTAAVAAATAMWLARLRPVWSFAPARARVTA